jgi:hypothetical protein
MLFFEADGVLFFALLLLWLFALVDVVTTDRLLCRRLPKAAWALLVCFVPDLGSVAWLLFGRPSRARFVVGPEEQYAPRPPIAYEDDPGWGREPDE